VLKVADIKPGMLLQLFPLGGYVHAMKSDMVTAIGPFCNGSFIIPIYKGAGQTSWICLTQFGKGVFFQSFLRDYASVVNYEDR